MAIVTMAFSFASIGSASPISNNDGSLVLTENVKPHTKEYIATKKIVDKYEQDIKKATTCEDLDKAAQMLPAKWEMTITNSRSRNK